MQALVTRPPGREHPHRRPRPVTAARLLESPWVSPTSRCAACCRRRSTSTCRTAAVRPLPPGQPALSDRPRRHRHGRVRPAYAEFDLPIVDGLVRAPRLATAAPAPSIDTARAALAARVVDAIQGKPRARPGGCRRSTSPTRTTPSSCSTTTRRCCTSARSAFASGCRRYLEIAEALRERIPDIDYVDLRFEQRVYVKPRGRAAGTAMHLATAGKTF